MMVSLPCIPEAVIVGVDDSLDDQRQLRLFMACEMVAGVLRQPGRSAEWSLPWHFRRMREELAAEASFDLESQQYVWAAQTASLSPEKVRKLIKDWMFDRPIAYLPACRYPIAPALCAHLPQQGIPAGVFSDYPDRDKLRGLGLTARVVVSATCGEVNRLKPDPTGLLVAAEKLGAPVPEC